MLLLRRHLAETAQLAAFHLALRHEHRIVAETVNATWPPDEAAGDDAFDGFDMAVRPSQAERTDKLGADRRLGDLVLHSAPDLVHGVIEILLGAGPPRRIDARRAVQPINRDR